MAATDQRSVTITNPVNSAVCSHQPGPGLALAWPCHRQSVVLAISKVSASSVANWSIQELLASLIIIVTPTNTHRL